MRTNTPIVQVPAPEQRGAERLLSRNFEDLSKSRRESLIYSFHARVEDPAPGGPEWLCFDQVDQSVHFPIQSGSNGLPVLLPKFFAYSLTLKRIGDYSHDERPPSAALIREYLKDSKRHFGSLLEETARAIGPLPRKCAISVLIPAAARDEAPFIGRTLRAFARQTAAADKFEVVVFLNCLDAQGRLDERSRATIAAVEEVQRTHPQLIVRPFFAALPESEVWTIGRIRKLLLDSTVLRAFQRSHRRPEHLLFTSDADCAAVHPELIAHTIERFKKHPEIDAIRGSIDWDWKSLAANPLLLFGVRLMSTLDAHRRLTDPTYGVGTPSFAIRAERYADAGGYHHLDRVGEDMELIERLKSVRTGSSSYVPVARGGPQSRIWTSLRRAEKALDIDTTPPQNMWFVDGARFQSDDPEVRKPPAPPVRSFQELLDAPDFEQRVNALATKTFRTYAHPNSSKHPNVAELTDAVSRISGIPFAMSKDESSVQVADFGRLRQFLLLFQQNAESYWRNHLGFEW